VNLLQDWPVGLALVIALIWVIDEFGDLMRRSVAGGLQSARERLRNMRDREVGGFARNLKEAADVKDFKAPTAFWVERLEEENVAHPSLRSAHATLRGEIDSWT
jgi:hypothetical protein